jgi:hypothetical protein
MKKVYVALAGLLALAALLLPIILIFVGAPSNYSALLAMRDAAIIYSSLFMCVGGILFVVLIGLLTYIVFLLREQTGSIIKKVDEILQTVKGTTTFVSESVVSPIIKTAGAAAGARAMVQTLMRRNPPEMQGDGNKEKKEEKS